MQEKIICPECSSKSTIKKGIRINQQQTIQQYKCKNCSNIFTKQPIKKKTYPIITILKAISFYNLGYSQSQIQKLLKISPKPSQKTISNWINEFSRITTSHRLRNEAKKLYSDLAFTQKEVIYLPDGTPEIFIGEFSRLPQ